MMMKEGKSCTFPDCPSGEIEKQVEQKIDGLIVSISDIKDTQSKLLEFFSDYKVLLFEIKSLNTIYSKLEGDNKEVHAFFFKEIAELKEKKANKEELNKVSCSLDSKAEKEDVKESRGWIWHIVTAAAAMLGGYFISGKSH